MRSIELAHYLITLHKVRVRKSRVLVDHFITILIHLSIRALLGHSFQVRLRLSRVLLGDFIKILILLWIRVLLGHSFQDRLRLTRVLQGYLCIYISHEVHWTRVLLGHHTLSQSSEISRISLPLYNNSLTPKNSRITWPLLSRQTSYNSRISWPLYNNSYTPKNSRITWPLYFKSESGNLTYYLATL